MKFQDKKGPLINPIQDGLFGGSPWMGGWGLPMDGGGTLIFLHEIYHTYSLPCKGHKVVITILMTKIFDDVDKEMSKMSSFIKNTCFL